MKKILILIILTFLVSCHTKKQKSIVKKRIIPEKQFVKVLVKYHLAEAISNSSEFRNKYKKIKKINLTDSIIKQFGYTRQDFDSTVSYYSGLPTEYDQIYDKVITELSRFEAASQKKDREQQKQKGLPFKKEPRNIR
jgi:hypothetical protein